MSLENIERLDNTLKMLQEESLKRDENSKVSYTPSKQRLKFFYNILLQGNGAKASF
jgi:hypothetical protein